MDRPLVRRTARPWINGSRLRQLNHVYARGRSHDERVVPVDHLNVHVAGRRGEVQRCRQREIEIWVGYKQLDTSISERHRDLRYSVAVEVAVGQRNRLAVKHDRRLTLIVAGPT